MELVIQQRFQIILAALDLLTLGGNVHTDAALLELQTPGPNKRNDESNGQQAVEQDLYRVIAADPLLYFHRHTVKINGLHDLAALDSTDGLTGLEPVDLAQPVDAAAGDEHICEENGFKQQEQQSAQDLTIVQVAHTKDQKRQLDCPVAVAEGTENIQHAILDVYTQVHKELNDALTQLYKKEGDRSKEHQEVVP